MQLYLYFCRFEPLLPPEKIMAIKRLGFGVLNKLVMFFPHAFWDESCDTFGHVNSSGGEGSGTVLSQ